MNPTNDNLTRTTTPKRASATRPPKKKLSKDALGAHNLARRIDGLPPIDAYGREIRLRLCKSMRKLEREALGQTDHVDDAIIELQQSWEILEHALCGHLNSEAAAAMVRRLSSRTAAILAYLREWDDERDGDGARHVCAVCRKESEASDGAAGRQGGPATLVLEHEK